MMREGTFFCIDAHTCGNPVRVVAGGYPLLNGRTMVERRQDFMARFDWIRRALMYEPRGHAMMSGAIVYPPCSEDADASILFIETSGCLPMCGHGTIGTVTVAIEYGLIQPKVPGQLILDVPAGKITVKYRQQQEHVVAVRLVNVASYLAHRDIAVELDGIGTLSIDVAYGGNYYAIVDQPKLFSASVEPLLTYSPMLRRKLNEILTCIHPLDASISGVSHILWRGTPSPGCDGRNLVFYGEKAIDRSPCGTGTSARMAQEVARGRLGVGDEFICESIIGSTFTGRVEERVKVGPFDAIIPSIEGWAKIYGENTIRVDSDDPYKYGFEVT